MTSSHQPCRIKLKFTKQTGDNHHFLNFLVSNAVKNVLPGYAVRVDRTGGHFSSFFSTSIPQHDPLDSLAEKPRKRFGNESYFHTCRTPALCLPVPHYTVRVVPSVSSELFWSPPIPTREDFWSEAWLIRQVAHVTTESREQRNITEKKSFCGRNEKLSAFPYIWHVAMKSRKRNYVGPRT